VIDFWMNWKDCDFKTAVEDLSEMLFEPKEGYDSDLVGGEMESP
jgi:hypothetical protein